MGKGVLVLTYACNLRCSFCYAAAEVFTRPKTMSPGEARRSVDFLAALGITSFTLLGGEPTVYRHLKELVAYSRSLGLGPWLVTNGTRTCDPDFCRALLDAGLKGGCVSLHGASAEDHDRQVGIPGSHAQALQTIAHAVENGWPLFPMLTIMNGNLLAVRRLIDTLVGLGCRTIYINYGLPNIVPEWDTGVDAGPPALAQMTERLFSLQEELNVRFRFNREKNKVPLCHFDQDTLRQMLTDEAIGTGCEAVQGNSVIIEPGGSVLGCSHWVDHPVLNIYRNFETLELISVEEFWESWLTGKAAQFRHELGWFPYEQCGDCDWRKQGLCYGGCKVWQSAGVLPRLARHDDTPAGPADNPILTRLSLSVLSELR
jgi:radical SAM protein with 4Fe4S-binding SPASM domain